MGTSAKNTLNTLPKYEPFNLNVFQMHPAECASEIKGTVTLRSAGGFGHLSVQAGNGFRRLSAGVDWIVIFGQIVCLVGVQFDTFLFVNYRFQI